MALGQEITRGKLKTMEVENLSIQALGVDSTTTTMPEEKYMFQRIKQKRLIPIISLLIIGTDSFGQGVPNLQCLVSGKVVVSGMGTEVYKDKTLSIEFDKQLIFVKGIPSFTMYADLSTTNTRIYGKYEDQLEGNKYRRIVDISRESGRIIMNTDDLSKDGVRMIGDLSGNCEKVLGKKF
jgi:hypothetical protein